MNLRDKEMRIGGRRRIVLVLSHAEWMGWKMALPPPCYYNARAAGGGRGGAGGISWMSLNGKSMVILPSWPPNASLLATTLTEVSNFYHLMRESDSK